MIHEHLPSVCRYFLLSFIFLNLIGCANPLPPKGTCYDYWFTDEKIITRRWYSCYKRGISLAREKECLEYARKNLLEAIQQRPKDKRWVRTFGMHRLHEYFPNRELGIVYYHLNEYDKALEYLEKSNEYCESAKAKFYINKVRRRILELTREDMEPPRLLLDPNALKHTAIPVIELSGEARDDTYVADIIIRINNKKPLSLMELSQPRSFEFREKIVLQTGLNDISIRVLDLLGKEEQQRIQILVDQEGPMIFFNEQENMDFNSQNLVQGLLYDPSDIARFTLNEKDVELIRIETDGDHNTEVSNQVYWFKYRLSINEWAKGVLSYRAEDSLKNVSEGILKIFKGEDQAVIQRVYSHDDGLLRDDGLFKDELYYRDDELSRDGLLRRIASASKAITSDLVSPFPFYQASESYQISKRRSLNSIRIEISQFPQETFEEDISPKIEIWASCQIKEIYIMDEPILSMYGLSWATFLDSILRRFIGKGEEGRFLFHRMIKLEKEGENIIPVVVVDQFGEYWESKIRIVKKTRRIHELDERWRMIIPLIGDNREDDIRWDNHGEDIQGDYQGEVEEFGRKMDLTNQIWRAFIDQSRFKVIDHRNLPILLREQDLRKYIGSSFLGLQKEHRIWIDICLLCSVEETENSFSLMASWVDFETGEILATKDVYEEIDSLGLYDETVWAEGLREHTYQNCCVLADKFEKHFPLCQGKVVHLTEEALKTSICRKDGLKNGMKLIIFEDINRDEEYKIIGEARVEEVSEIYSLAQVIKEREIRDINDTLFNNALMDWWVITR